MSSTVSFAILGKFFRSSAIRYSDLASAEAFAGSDGLPEPFSARLSKSDSAVATPAAATSASYRTTRASLQEMLASWTVSSFQGSQQAQRPGGSRLGVLPTPPDFLSPEV